MIVLDFGKLGFCSAQPMNLKHKHFYEEGGNSDDDGTKFFYFFNSLLCLIFYKLVIF